MAKASFSYLSDNGTTYNVAWESANEAVLAGNLPAPVTLNPLFPSLWIPRYMLVRATIGGVLKTLRCICNSTNTAWLSGPGATVTVSAVVYTVQDCIGEVRSPD